MRYCYIDSPVGPLLIAGDDAAVHAIRFARKRRAAKPDPGWTAAAPTGAVAEATQQLREYFAGKRTEFDLPLEPVGTAFQKSVWRSMQEIPYGETMSYGELARRVGKPKASRAVGSANGKNPLSIVVPCHRVIAAGGKIGGFGNVGLTVKQMLLNLEANRRSSAADGPRGSARTAAARASSGSPAKPRRAS